MTLEDKLLSSASSLRDFFCSWIGVRKSDVHSGLLLIPTIPFHILYGGSNLVCTIAMEI